MFTPKKSGLCPGSCTYFIMIPWVLFISCLERTCVPEKQLAQLNSGLQFPLSTSVRWTGHRGSHQFQNCAEPFGLACASDAQWQVWHFRRSLCSSSIPNISCIFFTVRCTHARLRDEPRTSYTARRGHFPQLLPLHHLPGAPQFLSRPSGQSPNSAKHPCKCTLRVSRSGQHKREKERTFAPPS